MDERGKGTPSGSTVLEMLVLLVALTVLLSLLLPVLQAGEVAGRELNCLEGLRVSGAEIDAYANDHDGATPAAAQGSRYSAEVFAHAGYDRRTLMADYVGTAGLPGCPATDAKRPDDAANTAAVLYGTYAWRGVDETVSTAAVGGPSAAVRAHDVMIDAQRGFGGFGQRYNHGAGVAATREHNPAFGGWWGSDPAGLNAVFGDGHAAWYGAGDVGVTGWATGQRQRRSYGPADAVGPATVDADSTAPRT